MRIFGLGVTLCIFLPVAFPSLNVRAEGSGDPTAVKEVNGQFFDKDGVPTYKILPDGTVDWYTFSGYLRYNSQCIVCHGPDGAGSTYAPALTDSLKSLSYGEFLAVVAQGRKNVSAATDYVMPAFGENKNVVCFLDNIFVYLRARSDGALGRGRPQKHVPKPPAVAKAEDECMGPL